MTACVIDLIPEFVLDTLGPAARRTVEDHLDQCNACTQELRAVSDAFALLALELPPLAPHPRERTLAAIADSGRFDTFAPAVAELYDVTVERACELLRYLEDPNRWIPGPGDGVSLLLVEPGPSFKTCASSFVRVDSGSTFPQHEHLGEEVFFVLQGSCLEPDGQRFRRGDLHVHAPHSIHSFVAPADGPPFIAAVRASVGIKLVQGG